MESLLLRIPPGSPFPPASGLETAGREDAALEGSDQALLSMLDDSRAILMQTNDYEPEPLITLEQP
jgi:hypothetical protein